MEREQWQIAVAGQVTDRAHGKETKGRNGADATVMLTGAAAVLFTSQMMESTLRWGGRGRGRSYHAGEDCCVAENRWLHAETELNEYTKPFWKRLLVAGAVVGTEVGMQGYGK